MALSFRDLRDLATSDEICSIFWKLDHAPAPDLSDVALRIGPLRPRRQAALGSGREKQEASAIWSCMDASQVAEGGPSIEGTVPDSCAGTGATSWRHWLCSWVERPPVAAPQDESEGRLRGLAATPVRLTVELSWGTPHKGG